MPLRHWGHRVSLPGFPLQDDVLVFIFWVGSPFFIWRVRICLVWSERQDYITVKSRMGLSFTMFVQMQSMDELELLVVILVAGKGSRLIPKV